MCTAAAMAGEMPTEEGYIYGRAPEPPKAPPDIHGMFETIGVPKGKLGELPYPVDWYDGAKERAAARVIEMENLLQEKSSLREQWAGLAVTDLESWQDRVDKKLADKGAVEGLAELLARAAHERPGDEARVQQLHAMTEQAFASLATVTEALLEAKENVIINRESIQMKEEEDAAAERTRLDEKRKADERKRKAEKALKRQAAALAGEELSDDSSCDDLELPARPPSPDPPTPRTIAASVGGTAIVTQVSPVSPAKVSARTYLGAPSGAGAYPSPELRQGMGQQLPPLDTSPSKAQRRPSSEGGSRGAGL